MTLGVATEPLLLASVSSGLYIAHSRARVMEAFLLR